MTIQATYHNTGLTPEDVQGVDKSGIFKVKWRSDECVHVMLYPKQYSDVKIQVLRFSANIWFQDRHPLHEIEELLNKALGDSSNPKPFKEPKIQLLPGERQKILETPLGVLSAFVYYRPAIIGKVLDEVIEHADAWYKPQRRSLKKYAENTPSKTRRMAVKSTKHKKLTKHLRECLCWDAEYPKTAFGIVVLRPIRGRCGTSLPAIGPLKF